MVMWLVLVRVWGSLIVFFFQRCDKPLVSHVMRLHLKSSPSEHILIASKISPILPLTQPIIAHLDQGLLSLLYSVSL